MITDKEAAKPEERIQRLLDRLTPKWTTLAIAERLSRIKDINTILATEDGRIGERGDHRELLAVDEPHASFWGVWMSRIDDLSPPPSCLSSVLPTMALVN